MEASFRAWALENRALVATTPMVVFPPNRFPVCTPEAIMTSSVSSQEAPSGPRSPPTRHPEAGSTTSPRPFTATKAPTWSSPTWQAQLPMPLLRARSMPRILPMVAPAPAPTLP